MCSAAMFVPTISPGSTVIPLEKMKGFITLRPVPTDIVRDYLKGEVQALQWSRKDSLITESSLYNFAMALDSHPSESTTHWISSRRASIYSGCHAMSNNR